MREPLELFTVVDIETTGLDYKNDQIIEIAAIQTNLFEEVGRLHLKVRLNPGKSLPTEISELTGITEQELTDAFPEPLAVANLALFAAGTTLVFHDAALDLAFFDEFGFRPAFFLCTRSMAKFHRPEKSSSLNDVCNRLGIEYKEHPRTMDNAEATVEVLKRLMRRLEEKGVRRIDYHNMVVDSEELPLTFIPKHAQVIKL